MSEAPSQEKIAETGIIIVQPGGIRRPVSLGIGRPYEDRGAWFCLVFIDGIDVPRAIGGADSLQALCQAINFLRKQLVMFRDLNEWKLVETDADPGNDDDNLFPIEACFGR